MIKFPFKLQIKSQNLKSSVPRRYNDFVNFHAQLLCKYSYRIIPRLPPKQLMLDNEWMMEERRYGLSRWLKLISQHKTIASCDLLKVFLTDSSCEHFEHLKEAAGQDEFITHKAQSRELAVEDQGKIAENRETMRIILNSVSRLKKLLQSQAQRAESQARDMKEMSSILDTISGESSVFRENTFAEISSGFKEISEISAKSSQLQQTAVGERLNIIMEVLTAHSDLCQRVEVAVLDHQKALSRQLTINKAKYQGVIRGTAALNIKDLNNKEMEQSGVVGNLANRAAFALNCVLEETRLVQLYLQCLPSILLSFAYEENVGITEICGVWGKIVTVEGEKLN